MFFGSGGTAHGTYESLLAVAKAVDTLGFASVWTPERHFDEFGGAFPNPAVIGAALAVVTTRVSVRGGSVIAPIHHTHRIVEEWAVVDRLSGGRVGISIGSGWNRRDFAAFPGRYDDRRELAFRQLGEIRSAWRTGNCPVGDAVLRVFPRPLQPELPVWVTSSGAVETFRRAGEVGANLLTHLLTQDLNELRRKLVVYRSSLAANGHDPSAKTVTLMLHAFVGRDDELARHTGRIALCQYLEDAAMLEVAAADAGGVMSGGRRMEPYAVEPDLLGDVTASAADRFLAGASLIGDVQRCSQVVARVAGIGVDEIACLVDFGVPHEEMLAGIRLLDDVRRNAAVVRRAN